MIRLFVPTKADVIVKNDKAGKPMLPALQHDVFILSAQTKTACSSSPVRGATEPIRIEQTTVVRAQVLEIDIGPGTHQDLIDVMADEIHRHLRVSFLLAQRSNRKSKVQHKLRSHLLEILDFEPAIVSSAVHFAFCCTFCTFLLSLKRASRDGFSNKSIEIFANDGLRVWADAGLVFGAEVVIEECVNEAWRYDRLISIRTVVMRDFSKDVIWLR